MILLLLFALEAPRYTLPQLIDASHRSHPLVAQSLHQLASAQKSLDEAQRAFWPSFTLDGLVAPSVDIKCSAAGLLLPNGTPAPADLCLAADIRNPIQAVPTGVLTRWEFRLNAPVYTFGRISAGADIGRENVRIGENHVEATKLDLTQQVARAYYGLKVARELLDMIKEGRGHLEDAIKQVEKELDEDKGNATESDRLRLKVAEATLDSRTLEAVKGEKLALAALHVLVPDAPESLDIDTEPIQPVDLPDRPVEDYINAARSLRPEMRIAHANDEVARGNVAIAKAALFPEISLTGNLFGLWASTDNDDPLSPYMMHPFASWGYGAGLVIRWGLDYHLKLPRYDRAKSDYQASLAGSRAWMDNQKLEVQQAYETVSEAHRRIDVLERAEKAAHSWITAIAQNFAIGTADAREFNDALVAYFDAHGRYLQAIYDFNVAVAWLSRTVGTDVTKLAK